MTVPTNNKHLKEVALVFLKLGCIGFGGPAVHLSMMEAEVVHKRKWISADHFLDLIGATNLIPGPNSTEMTMHCGHERAGWKGLIVAGLCFILPAVFITAVFAWLYQQYGKLPTVEPFIYGIKPAIISVIVALMISLGRKALKTVELGIIGLLAAALALYGINGIAVLFGAGLIGVLFYYLKNNNRSINGVAPFFFLKEAITPGNLKLFWIFLKIGSILYGSGYVLFAFLNAELVDTGLLSKQVLMDAIAVGQFTPGPVFSSATFIGWQMGGLPGAVLATIGIFLPSFFLVALLNPLLPRLRKSKAVAVFLDTVNMVSIALIAVVCLEMGKAALVDWRTITIALLGFVCTMCFKKLNTAFVIIGGAVLGYGLYLI
jgi:chromate transporter